jgi:pilus assembly protein Flp/PilA
MKRLFDALWRDESGATAIEYGLIAGLMAAVLIVALTGFSEKLTTIFNAINDQLQSAADKVTAAGGGGTEQ